MSKLNVSSLGQLQFGDSLKTHDNLHSIVELLVEKVKAIPRSEDLHLNIDLIVYICLAIDNILRDSKLTDVDKFQLFTSVYTAVFPDTTPKEFKTILAVIDYLHGNSLISAISKAPWAVICRRMKSFVKIVLGVLSATN
jgi:hypothetical protein